MESQPEYIPVQTPWGVPSEYQEKLPDLQHMGTALLAGDNKGFMLPSVREELKKQKIIHDREKPQKPPHKYISGPCGPLHYGSPYSDSMDAGVCAVSKALFGNASFSQIPLSHFGHNVFRRRREKDTVSEWSNAFVSRVDPCECSNPEITYKYDPYEVSRFRGKGGLVGLRS